MNKKDINYTVSVRLMTYMHAPFIKEAMEGIMMQETDFKVEIVIGDDFSTDGTLDIIRTYSDTDNIHIKILKREKGDAYWQKRQELGRLYNFINILENCSGKYVALLDGDDYWTDPLKLQKQVEFLEANKEYSMCFHKVDLIHPDLSISEDNITNVPVRHETIENLASRGNYIHTPSVLFRNDNLEWPDGFKLVPIGDFFLYMLLASNGKIGYIQEKMAVYRVGSGIWSGKSAYERNLKTAYTFALLIKTDLFSDKVNHILIERIQSFLKRFQQNIDLESLVMLSITPSIERAIYQCFIDSNRKENPGVSDDLTFKQLISRLKRKLINKTRIWK
ncbi:glycosyltransferase [Psychroflexus sp. CAK8W]|uniref:Glycosyltransferase n=1 Tax=Psychroflexus longus TaxID=2873596 RepID=A0ABS7XN12_9FLAO|nr:glycosyltransferase [Psychroflexus longus]MBZ9779446.1 glycosyltransferase [Psychroflexus longus]